MESLAKCVGRRLTRINLSEQTEISDLIGSDLPVASTSSNAEFMWFDGVLLTAIKRGDWVLLDELNLASQAVLEGLNSCLDHRAEVFVPDIGLTFKCPPGFRIFAAQNPLGQGGGRKGLPKSFLNRFSKVFVEPLTVQDFQYIVCSRFPALPNVEKLIAFNNCLSNKANGDTSFAKIGSPWEFNLRDIFRFCILKTSRGLDDGTIAKYLYGLRLRSQIDRITALQTFEDFFGKTGLSTEREVDFLSQEQSGPRKMLHSCPIRQSCCFLKNATCLRGIQECVAMRWPCLLTGAANDSILACVRSLAISCGAPLQEISMTSASDVSELIGSYDHVDVFTDFHKVAKRVLSSISPQDIARNESLETLASDVRRSFPQTTAELNRGVDACENLVELLLKSVKELTKVRHLNEVKTDISRISQASGKIVSSFVWSDGPLVSAMQRGEWLHLLNVNLCSSSVLDRLNSVMEPNGSLLLAEAGVDETTDGCTHRKIECHPNFRLFLSMNPSYGEVSRAMRNRCVEISIDNKPQEQTSKAACFFDEMSSFGICSFLSSNRLLEQTEKTSDKSDINAKVSFFGHTASFASAFACRGTNLLSTTQQLPKKSEIEMIPSHVCVGDDSMLFSTRSVRSLNLLACTSTNERWDLVRQTASVSLQKDVQAVALDKFMTNIDQQLFRQYLAFSMAKKLQSWGEIQITACNSLLSDKCDLDVLSMLCDQNKVKISRHCSDHVFRELAWQKRRSEINSHASRVPTLLEASFEWFNSHLRGDSVEPRIKIVSLIFPFFNAIDLWLENRYDSGKGKNKLEHVCQQRNMLWVLSAETSLSAFCTPTSSSLAVFITQWEELVTSLGAVTSREEPMTEISGFVESISNELLKRRQTVPEIKSLLKYMPFPALPRTQTQWDVLLQLQQVSQVFTPQMSVISFGLDGMIKNGEACLVDVDDLVKEALAMMSTLFASTLSFKKDRNLDSTMIKLSAALNKTLGSRVGDFYSSVSELKVDLSSPFSDSLLQVEELERHHDLHLEFAVKAEVLSTQLLDKMATIQLSILVEHYMEQIEMDVLDKLYGFVNKTVAVKTFQDLHPNICSLISVGTNSLWTTVELSLYQVLVWLIELRSTDINYLRSSLRRVLPLLSANASKRSKRSARTLLDTIPLDLRVPILIEGDLNSSSLDISRRAVANSTIPTAFTLSLLQPGFNSDRYAEAGYSFLTIENALARHRQGAQFLRMMSRLSDYGESRSFGYNEVAGEFSELHHVILETISTQDTEKQENEAIEAFSCFVSTDTAERIVRPLVASMAAIQEKIPKAVNDHELAKAFVLIGLLQLHFFAPDSPVDPGSRPDAMMAIITIRMNEIFHRIHAEALEFVWSKGCVLERSDDSVLLVDEARYLQLQFEKERANAIERPSVQKPFSAVYDELGQFIASHGSLSTVFGLMNGFSTSHDKDSAALENWFTTVDAFCERISGSAYAVYEDVVCRIVGALGKIRRGLRVLMHNKLTSGEKVTLSLMFPFSTENSSCCDLLVFASTTCDDNPVCKKNLAIAALHRLVLERKAHGVEENNSNTWERALGLVFSSECVAINEDLEFLDKDYEGDDNADAAVEGHFPNHVGEYEKLADQDDSSTSEEMEVEAENGGNVVDMNVSEIACMICELHTLYFTEGSVESEFRLKAFMVHFDAVSSCQNAGCEIDIIVDPAAASLAFALSLSSDAAVRMRVGRDFYNDPNAAESLKAYQPLSDLRAKAMYLLKMFPGNSVLGAILRIVDKVLKLDLRLSSFGKVMSGVEVLLRHAQDWEQHASSRIQLSKPLERLQSIAIEWRKMEISTWESSLQSREQRFMKKAKEKWYHLYAFLRSLVSPPDKQRCSVQRKASAPSWVWRSFPDINGYPDYAYDLDLVVPLAKALDTFCLTASIGEFDTRLSMLQTFASQFGCPSEGSSTAISRTLKSIHDYYNQFRPRISEYLSRVKRSIEDDLKSEVKLAKWDCQTYFAMAQSSERNRKKVVRILGQYDTVLRENISAIVVRDLCSGIRADPDSKGDVLTAVPPTGSLFPLCFDPVVTTVNTVPHEVKSFFRDTWKWQTLAIIDISKGSNSKTIGHFFQKMKRLATNPNLGSAGAGEAAELCSAIFSRIDSLRSLKAHRQMKERALSDLFRVLETQGYSLSRANVPSELMNMSDLVQLPGLETSNAADDKSLGSAESYFQRCLAETHRFQMEVQMIGSDHMTKRQLETMLNVCYQGLHLLCQQRSMLAHSMYYRKRLDSNLLKISSMANKTMKFHRKFAGFSRHCMLLVDDLMHACVYLDSLEPLAKEDCSRHRECTNRLQNAMKDVEKSIEKCMANRPTFWFLIDDVIAVRKDLCTLRATVEHIQPMLAYVPASPLKTCIGQIDTSLSIASELEEFFVGSNGGDDEEISEDFRSTISLAVQNALLSFQGLTQATKKSGTKEISVWLCHEECAMTLMKIGLQRMDEAFETVSRRVETLDPRKSSSALCLYFDTCILYDETLKHIDVALSHFITFYRGMGKLSYVLVRIFRVLAASGFCSQKEEDDEAEKDASGMTFDEPAEGTGMGEGEGGNDVTDQIENEEQLLGLKDDNDEQNQESDDKKELNEEEAENGMEMEAEFEGSLYDVPKKDPDSTKDDSGDEEVERDMGESGDDGNEVIDERLWNDSDDENDDGNESNPIEQDSAVKGDGKTDEMTTNDSEQAEQPPSPENGPDQGDTDGNHDDPDKNDDGMIAEETFEDKHNVEVSNQKEETETNEDALDEGENDLELDENLSMDSSTSHDEPQGLGAEADETSPEMDLEPKVEDDDQTENSDEAEGREEGTTQAIPEDEEGVDQDGASQTLCEVPDANNSPQKGLGTQAAEGNDSLIGTVEEEVCEDGGEGEGENGIGNDELEIDDSDSPQGNSSSNNGGSAIGNHGGHMEKSGTTDKAPNPLGSPGDATDFWHKKLSILERDNAAGEEHPDKEDHEDCSKGNDFDFVRENEAHTSQVLGPVDEENSIELEDNRALESEADDKNRRPDEGNNPPATNSAHSKAEDETKTMTSDAKNSDMQVEIMTDGEGEEIDNEVRSSTDDDSFQAATTVETQVVSNFEQLKRSEGEEDAILKFIEASGEILIHEAELDESRRRWSQIQNETSQLARRLCEKLRLVIEPLLASKLRGDYRTGKRINMKRVIGYIASGYQKDKIWLRRTKPAKRNYRVLLAVDDSQSMLKSGAGSMALRALSTLAVGMSQLEIGEVGVASFGNEMNLILPFQEFFTSADGANILQHFKFDQARTRTAFCMESACQVLDSASSQAMQIMFIVSDGRIERDSRSAIRRLIREMMERNILLVLIIVESGTEDSIMNMKEVSFEKGKPVVRNFMEDYPFPYYILLSNMERLPEVLGDALRQWFELIARTA